MNNKQAKTQAVRAHAAAFFKGFAQGCVIVAVAQVIVFGAAYYANKKSK